jgi:outer membrane murein-binding lipoprotein Lpp
MKKNKMDIKLRTIIEIAGIAGTLILGGMRLGSVETKVATLESKKDVSEDVATLKTKVEDIRSDLKELKVDIKTLLKR